MLQPFCLVTPLQQQHRPSAPLEQFYRRYTPSPNPFRNLRPPLRHNNPYEDRYYQETTYNTSSTRGSKSDSIKVKREEVSQFNPLYKDPNNLGVVVDRKNLIYTNVYYFIDYINTFIEDTTIYYNIERQILDIFQTLLGGSIVIQQTNELIAKRRTQLRKIGLEYILQELYIRFDTDIGIAIHCFNNGIVTLKDIVKDDIALLQYVQKILRYARSASLLNNNNSNQYSPIITIQSNIDIKIRQYLRLPDQDDSQSLANYIRQVEKVRTILLAAIYNIYLQYIKKKPGKSSSKPDKPLRKSSSYKKDHSSCKERYEYRKRCCEEDYRYSSYRWWRDCSRHYKERSSSYRKREEDRDRDRRNRDRRDIRYYNDKRDYKDQKYRDQDYVYFIEGSSSSNVDKLDSISFYSASSSRSSSNSSSKEVAYIVIDANLIYYKCYYTFIAYCNQKRYIKVYKGSRLLKYKRRAICNTLNPSRCIYSFYSSLFPIYSQLFQYLKIYKDIKNSTLRRPTNLASLLAEAKQQTIQ